MTQKNKLLDLLTPRNTFSRYSFSDSYIRLYDEYRKTRRIAQDDKLYPSGDYCYLPWYREYASKKCKRLLYKLTHVRTYQTLIESNEKLKLALFLVSIKKNIRFLIRCSNDSSYQENIFHDDFEIEKIFAILRVIAGVIRLADEDYKFPYFASILGEAREVKLSAKSYNLARKLEASLKEDGFSMHGYNRLRLYADINNLLYATYDPKKEIHTSLQPYEVVAAKYKKGHHITPSKRHQITRQMLVRQATLLSRRLLKFEGKNRFPAEAIEQILGYIDGTHTDKRSIQRIQSAYDQEIIDGYFDKGEYDKASPFRLYPSKYRAKNKYL
jgi:hypothetical protein